MPSTGSTSSSLSSRTFDKKAKYCKDKWGENVNYDKELLKGIVNMKSYMGDIVRIVPIANKEVKNG